MGCDIHLFIEHWSNKPDKFPFRRKSSMRDRNISEILNIDLEYRWVGESDFSDYDFNRSYYIFSILANVRNNPSNIIPISEPRGIPEDASDSYLFVSEDYGNDGHSHSYFLLSELLEVDWFGLYGVDVLSGSFGNLLERLKSIKEDPKNIRLVFFFDN